jgi:hypothetical protein
MRRLRTLLIPAIAVALAGCGGSSTATVRAPAATKQIIYSPFSAAGKPLLKTVQTVNGTCQGSDDLIRPDAWRCFLSGNEKVKVAGGIGANLLDPCFSNENTSNLYCVLNPLAKTAILLKPTGLSYGDRASSDLSQLPWEIVLTSGADCGLLSGATSVLDGKRQNYSCSDRTTLYGNPSKSSKVWTIFGAAKGATGLTQQSIRSVYY